MGKTQMIDELATSGILGNSLIAQAFNNIDRTDFVPEEESARAYNNEPLSIGFGQTISQPWTVAFMLDLLEPGPGMKILDIGTGSGFQAALLGHIVSHDLVGGELPGEQCGLVVGLEIIPDLCAAATSRLNKYGLIRRGTVEVHCLNAIKGFEDDAPYDRIISAASGSEVPQNWKDQLKVGGRMVVPIDNQVLLLAKQRDGTFTERRYDSFSFVPFVAG